MSQLEMNLQKGLVGHWTMSINDKSGGTAYDSTAYEHHGSITDPTTNYFGPSAAGYWRGDVEQLGAVDGFNDVGKADATSNSTYEDIFTGQFTTSDFSNSGAGYYVYMAFAAKWNEIPNWEDDATWLEQPSPNSNEYQLYILRSDGQNSRDEYFRIYYRDANDTGVGRIADPFVWTQDDEGPNAEIIGSGGSRTVVPFTEGKIGESIKSGSGSVDWSSPTNLQMQTEFTVSHWIRGPTGMSSGVDEYLTRDASGIRFQRQGGDDLYFGMKSPNNRIDEGITVNDISEWQHIVATFNKPEYNVYKNGTNIITGSFDYNPRTGQWRTYERRGTSKYDLSDVRIYDRALTATEVENLYQMRSLRTANL